MSGMARSQSTVAGAASVFIFSMPAHESNQCRIVSQGVARSLRNRRLFVGLEAAHRSRVR